MKRNCGTKCKVESPQLLTVTAEQGSMANDTDELDDWLAGDAPSEAGAASSSGAGVEDVWGGDSDDGDLDPFSAESSSAPAQRETLAVRQEKALRAKHYKEGFKEAIGQAREDSLQQGFGEGFKEAFALGLRTGRVVGLCTTMQQFVKDEAATENLTQMAEDSKAFAKRPIDEAKLAKMEALAKDIRL